MEELGSKLKDIKLDNGFIKISRKFLGGFSFSKKGTICIPGYPV
jgi:hypothetical protein